MYKNVFLIVVTLFSVSANSQNFGISVKDHPYYNIIEWKGKGGLLMSRSVKEFMNQIEFSLVADRSDSEWDQKLNPKIREPYYIFNENTRYVYLLDNLDLVDNGRATFNQLNYAGNIKSKVLDVGLKVKAFKAGYEYNKFELLNASVTDKVLVYHYRYYDKKEKEYREFATFMTHHNLSHNVFELGYADSKEVDAGEIGQWCFTGFTNDTTYFSWRETLADSSGWTVKGFETDGEVVEDYFFPEPRNIIKFRNIGYGNTGKYYVNNDDRNAMETGLLSYINDEFYTVVVEQNTVSTELVLMKRTANSWERINSVHVEDGALQLEKEDFKLGAFPINEGITYRYKYKGQDRVGILLFDKATDGVEQDFNERIVYNPSSLLVPQDNGDFVTMINEKILTCNYDQFARSGGVNFEYK